MVRDLHDDHPNVTYLTQAAGCDEMAISPHDGTKPFKTFSFKSNEFKLLVPWIIDLSLFKKLIR